MSKNEVLKGQRLNLLVNTKCWSRRRIESLSEGRVEKTADGEVKRDKRVWSV